MKKKYLCVCQYGHSRSVALARLLHSKGHAAVAVGHATCGDAINVLGQWADEILILDDGFLAHIPQHFWPKVTSFHVGPDVWVNPYNQDLAALLETLYRKHVHACQRCGFENMAEQCYFCNYNADYIGRTDLPTGTMACRDGMSYRWNGQSWEHRGMVKGALER